MRLRPNLHLKSTNRNCWIGWIWKNELFIFWGNTWSPILYTLYCVFYCQCPLECWSIYIGHVIETKLTHWGLVVQIYVLMKRVIICSNRLTTCLVSNHLLNHRWLIVNWTLRILQKNLNQYGKFSCKNMHLMMLSAKWIGFYSNPHGLNPISVNYPQNLLVLTCTYKLEYILVIVLLSVVCSVF